MWAYELGVMWADQGVVADLLWAHLAELQWTVHPVLGCLSSLWVVGKGQSALAF